MLCQSSVKFGVFCLSNFLGFFICLIMKKLFYFLTLCLFLASCGGDDESDVVIIAKTKNPKEIYNSGEKIIFEIESFANKGFITSIDIYTVTSYALTSLLDTVIDAEKTSFLYEYDVPQFDADTTDVKFYFKAYCSTNNSSEMVRTHRVLGDILLHAAEYTMYASYKNEKNGFSIARNEIVDCETTDSIYIDFYDYSVDTTQVLSREWRSKTGLLFARFNDFDFENANYSSVKNSYSNSNKTSKLLNVSNEDIVLVGNLNEALGVLKVINVFDEADPMQDRYYFVFKSLK